MKLLLLFGVIVVFFISFFTSGYESKPGVPKKDQMLS